MEKTNEELVEIRYVNTYTNQAFNLILLLDCGGSIESHIEVCRKYLQLVGFMEGTINEALGDGS